jgi:RNA polymerase sigma-70 factor, ECF subfamily
VPETGKEQWPDESLVAALNEGDPSAFEALYHRYREWIVSLAYRLTGNRDDALDVLQETFAYFHRKFPGFVLSCRLTTFLYPVVKNLSIAARRKRRRFIGSDEAMDLVPAPPGDADAPEHMEQLSAALMSLPGIHREVLLMRFIDDMPLEEIAAALGIPLGTVKSRLHNAIEAVRKGGQISG